MDLPTLFAMRNALIGKRFPVENLFVKRKKKNHTHDVVNPTRTEYRITGVRARNRKRQILQPFTSRNFAAPVKSAAETIPLHETRDRDNAEKIRFNNHINV